MNAPQAAHTAQPTAGIEMSITNPQTSTAQEHHKHENCQHDSKNKSMRLRGGGAGKDCFLCIFGCFICFECCEGCCDCVADIICCPCEMCC
ncbi:hypothetical protein CYLTODRAFT_487706 [Cylindrobasidium torrendii FP15055 ss-10]|uniref:Cysteine-rich transmembrane CYSTM domain-containing protein n=1 Tax=Cylindrobasidium torrendii FP15055 ss-10 TaxID=1314674 RepID=A0A0D7BMJ5_9AGAR|nr:hypothetical protein CYLTODRAFT_487706 [Cylindrobasidium torrendii FP15055 ss-10]